MAFFSSTFLSFLLLFLSFSLTVRGQVCITANNQPATVAIPNSDLLGGNGPFSFNCCPETVTFSPTTGKMFVSEAGARILRFPSPFGFNATPDGVFGQPDFVNTSFEGCTAKGMYTPRGMWVDLNDNLWVADDSSNNGFDTNRVMMFASASTATNFPDATIILGQPNPTTCSVQLVSDVTLNKPTGVIVDSKGNLWVADSGNFRVVRYPNSSSLSTGGAAVQVLGSIDLFTIGAGQFQPASAFTFNPHGVILDGNENLYIIDTSPDRILRFKSPLTLGSNASADGVIGQPNFTTTTNGPTFQPNYYSSFNNLAQVAFDPVANRLIVSDSTSCRALVFDSPNTTANFPNAIFELGQPSLTSGACQIPVTSQNIQPVATAFSIKLGGVFLTTGSRVVGYCVTPATSASPAASSLAAASSSQVVAASSQVVAASSQVVAASSQVVAASSSIIAASSSKVVAASSSQVVAASSSKAAAASSSKAAAASSSKAAAASSSKAAAASSQVVAASSQVAATKSKSRSQSNTPSQTNPLVAASSGVTAASSVVVAQSSVVVAQSSVVKSISVAKSKTLTGLAAITCRQQCQVNFVSCKKTTRRLRQCKRSKKQCVSGCGVVHA